MGRIHHLRHHIDACERAPQERARQTLEAAVLRPGNPIQKIAAGASDDDYHWTEVFMRETGKFLNGLSIHYYTWPGGPKWDDKRASTQFAENEWIETLSKALRIDELITKHSAIMDRMDPDRKSA